MPVVSLRVCICQCVCCCLFSLIDRFQPQNRSPASLSPLCPHDCQFVVHSSALACTLVSVSLLLGLQHAPVPLSAGLSKIICFVSKVGVEGIRVVACVRALYRPKREEATAVTTCRQFPARHLLVHTLTHSGSRADPATGRTNSLLPDLLPCCPRVQLSSSIIITGFPATLTQISLSFPPPHSHTRTHTIQWHDNHVTVDCTKTTPLAAS